MTDSPTPPTPSSSPSPDALARHLRDALRNADHPDARYHIRHALQYAAVGADDADDANLDPDSGSETETETGTARASDSGTRSAATDDR